MISLKNNRQFIIVIAAIIVLSLISIVCFNNKDCEDISIWASKLYDSLFEGRIRYFAIDCYEMGYPTNYGAFSNVICALWILPVYIIAQIIGSANILAYCIWIKIGILIINFFVAEFVYRIINRFNTSINKSSVYLIWFSFNLVQISSLGYGQIDCIGILLMLIAVYFYFEERMMAFSLIAGASLCFKVFPVIVIAVLFALILARYSVATIKYIVMALILPVTQIIIEKVFFIDYDICEYIGFEYSNSNFIDRMFSNNINISVSPFIFVAVALALLVYILRRNDLIRDLDALFVSGIIYFVFYITVLSHSQWYLYILPIILIIGLSHGITSEFMLIGIILNVSQIVYNSSTTKMVGRSLLGNFVEGGKEFDYNILLGNVSHASEYAASIFYGALLAVLIYYIIIRVLYARDKKPIRAKNIYLNKLLIWVLYATTFVGEMLIVINY